MYCPNCKIEMPGKFCIQCGARLVEKLEGDNIELNIGGNAAVVGGVNISTNNTHTTEETINVHYAPETPDSTNVPRTQRTLQASINVLNNRDRNTLMTIDRLIDNNNQAVDNQIQSLATIAGTYNIEEVQYKYNMLLAALRPEELIREYERGLSEGYWQTYWVTIAYIKCGNTEKAQEAMNKLDCYQEHPEDNSLPLSAVSAYSEFGSEAAIDFINATLPNRCSPLLLPFIQAIFLKMCPARVDEIDIEKGKAAFYTKYLASIESPAEKADKIRKAEEEKLKAEAERRKAEEERIRIEEERLKAEKERIKIEEERRKAEEERIRIEEERRKAEKERIRIEEERRKAEEEDIISNHIIGEDYYFGRKGKAQSYTEAVKYFRMSAEKGYAQCGRLYRIRVK